MKTIIVHIPMGCEDTRVIKKVDLVDGLSATIEVTEEQDDNRNAPSPDEKKVFFCYQDKVKTRFYPTAYAFLETTSNHYVRCHPVNKNKGVLDIYVRSLEDLLRQFERFGINCFWRVHDSFAVNCDYIMDYKNGKLTVRGAKNGIPVSDSMKEELEKRICVIKHKFE